MFKKIFTLITVGALSIGIMGAPVRANEANVRNTVEWTEGTEAFEELGFPDEIIEDLINLKDGESITYANPRARDQTYTTSTLISTDWGVPDFIQYHPDERYGQPNFYIGYVISSGTFSTKSVSLTGGATFHNKWGTVSAQVTFKEVSGKYSSTGGIVGVTSYWQDKIASMTAKNRLATLGRPYAATYRNDTYDRASGRLLYSSTNVVKGIGNDAKVKGTIDYYCDPFSL